MYRRNGIAYNSNYHVQKEDAWNDNKGHKNGTRVVSAASSISSPDNENKYGNNILKLEIKLKDFASPTSCGGWWMPGM